MKRGQSAHRAEGHRYLEAETEHAVLDGALRQAGIAPASRCVGVPAGFHRPKVVARGEDYRVDTVVYAFVVRHGPEGVHRSNAHCFAEALGKDARLQLPGIAAQLGNRTLDAGPDATVRCVVGKNRHDDLHIPLMRLQSVFFT